MSIHEWHNLMTFAAKDYTCGYCGKEISSNKGYYHNASGENKDIYICHGCNRPTFFDSDGKQTPGELFGDAVTGINNTGVQSLYNEARECTKTNSYTAAVMCCRKLLMHIAVDKGAEKNKNFLYYVEYLSENHFVPPDSKDWMDQIRIKGNDANHEIVIMNKNDAEELISFTEMILKFIYEFHARMKKSTPINT